MFNQITIIGVGLIGGSLAQAVKRQGLCRTIVGHGRHEDHLKTAVAMGVIDRYELEAVDAVRDADLILLAVPVCAIKGVLQAIAGAMKTDAIVTDVGSVKGAVVDAARAVLPDLSRFVPGHPIAGTEKSGVEASFPTLFRNRKVILTPLPENTSRCVDSVKHLWESAGSEVVTMGVRHHDEVLAATSHMPHMLAFSLVDCLAQMHERVEIFQFAAGGFKDFTRIASSDPTMWADIAVTNSDALLMVMDTYRRDLDGLIEAIADRDKERIKTIFEQAKQTRDQYCSDSN